MKPKNENDQNSKQNHLKNREDKREVQGKDQKEDPIEEEIDEITESKDTDNSQTDISPGITEISVDEDEPEKAERQEQAPAIEVQKTDLEKSA